MRRVLSLVTMAAAMNTASSVAAQNAGTNSFLLKNQRAALSSEFFEFFNLSQESATLLTDGGEHFVYRPGGAFGPSALVSLLVKDGRVVGATLSVHRSFLDHRVNGVFARDLVGSFVEAAAHEVDVGDARALATLIKEGAADLASTMLGEATPTSQALAAVKDRAADVTVEFEATSIRLRNGPGVDDVESLRVAITPSAGAPSPEPDQSTARAVVHAIFEAARTDNPSLLHDLCDPRGENDGDTARLCGLTLDSSEWPEFREAFSEGRLNGPVTYDGRSATRTAAVPIVFGPGGQSEETMFLVSRNGRWYLSSF